VRHIIIVDKKIPFTDFLRLILTPLGSPTGNTSTLQVTRYPKIFTIPICPRKIPRLRGDNIHKPKKQQIPEQRSGTIKTQTAKMTIY
jgi:hypothetical protein